VRGSAESEPASCGTSSAIYFKMLPIL